MRHSWYTIKREDRSDIAFLSLKQRGESDYSEPVQFSQSELCDESLMKLPYMSGYIQWRSSDSNRGYRLKVADRALRLLGFDEGTVRNACAEVWPA